MADKLQILVNATLAKGSSKSLNDQIQAIKIRALKIPVTADTTALKKLLKDLNVQFAAASKAAGSGVKSPAELIFDKAKLDKLKDMLKKASKSTAAAVIDKVKKHPFVA